MAKRRTKAMIEWDLVACREVNRALAGYLVRLQNLIDGGREELDDEVVSIVCNALGVFGRYDRPMTKREQDVARARISEVARAR